MQLLYGTYNPAKLAAMRRRLSGSGISLISLSELESPPAPAVEDGCSPLENARIKAAHYRDATGMTVLAADSGLYIEGLSPGEQPAEHPRRMQGGRMDDEAMIAYYAAVATRLGGRAVAYYQNGLCIAFADGRMAEVADESVASERFYLVDVPHAGRTPGFPLDSLSVEIATGRYYMDLGASRGDSDLAQMDGIRTFVLNAMEGLQYAGV